jgi:hypothetical protein
VGLATAGALQAQLTHQRLERAAGHRDPLAVRLAPHLAGAVDAEVLGMDPADLGLELGIAHGPGRGRSAFGVVVGGRGIGSSWQIGSTPEPVPVGIDVGDHLLDRTPPVSHDQVNNQDPDTVDLTQESRSGGHVSYPTPTMAGMRWDRHSSSTKFGTTSIVMAGELDCPGHPAFEDGSCTHA